MTSEEKRSLAIRPQVLPPEHTHDIHMPTGTPLGLGIFGAMRYAAIRRVLEEYEKARWAKARAHEAEAGEADALLAREVARQRLRNIDTILADETNRIQHLHDTRLIEHTALLRKEDDAKDDAKIAGLRRTLERLELEERIAIAQGRVDARKKVPAETEKRDEHKEFLDELGRIPELVAAARSIKAKIAEGSASPGDEGVLDEIDALVQGWIAKQAEAKIY